MAHPTYDEPGAHTKGTGTEPDGGEELGRGRIEVPRRQAVTEAHSTNNAPGDRTDSTAAPTRSEARGTREEQLITIATYNLSDGRLAGLESAGRAFKEGEWILYLPKNLNLRTNLTQPNAMDRTTF